MRAFAILAALATTLQVYGHEQWSLKVHDQRTIVLHTLASNDGEPPPDLKGLEAALADYDRSKPLRHVCFWDYFNHDPALQRELMQQFETHYPGLLKDALESSGNKHNPKVIPLGRKLNECLLQTATVKELDAIFRSHGHAITRISHEKFSIFRNEDSPQFSAIVWLILEPNEEADRQTSTGQ